jgi:hypothetical protein
MRTVLRVLPALATLTLLPAIGCSSRDASPADGTTAEGTEALGKDGSFLGGFFPIAADFQPPHLFDTWKGRGINTMIRVPGQVGVDEWTDKANALGLKMIREPRGDAHRDLNEKNLLAWEWYDEPELNGRAASDLTDFRKRLHALDPARPILVNFWGGGIVQSSGGCFNGHCYDNWINDANWVSADIYPCDKYGCKIELVGKVVSQLRHWSTNRQSVFAYIESGDVHGDGNAPSPIEIKAEVWDSIIHGARGIFYFAARIKPNCSTDCLAGYDDTSHDVSEAMGPFHARLERLAPVLQRAIDPQGFSMQAGGALEAGWRQAADGTRYFIVLNTSGDKHKDAKLEVHGIPAVPSAEVFAEGRNVRVGQDKTIVDDFEPYEAHVYVVAP